MDFRLFGPVTVHAHGRRVDIGKRQHELFLALLASRSHASIDWLRDQLWPLDLPETAMPKDPRRRLYEIACDVRGAFKRSGVDAGAILSQEHSGYCLLVDPSCVDLHRFADLRRRAMKELAASADGSAVELFREAFRQWDPMDGLPHRITPLAGLSGPWVEAQRHQLALAYRSDFIACVETELRLGRHHQVLAELAERCAAAPLDEDLAGLRMQALYGAGQPCEALDIYRLTRERIDAEIGGEPGEKLRGVHRSIMRQDPSLSLASAGRPHLAPPISREENAVAKNQFKNVAKGHSTVGVQTSQFHGVYHGAASEAPSALEEQATRLRKAIRAAQRDDVLSADTAEAARTELGRAVSHLKEPGEFAAAMANVKRLVDGADELTDLAEALLCEGLRGKP